MILVVEEATGYIGFGAVFRLSINASTIDSYFTWCIPFFSFGKLTNFISVLAMASSVPLEPNYAYVVIRLKMIESVNSLVDTTILCHYGETNDVFPIGDLV